MPLRTKYINRLTPGVIIKSGEIFVMIKDRDYYMYTWHICNLPSFHFSSDNYNNDRYNHHYNYNKWSCWPSDCRFLAIKDYPK